MSKTSQLSAKERIESLLDENSFVEIGAAVTRRNTDFNMQEKSIPGDGVITGYGMVDCKLVYVYSQDAQVLGGSIGEMHAKKISRVYDLAMKVGAPVVGLIDCAGLRLQEATDALAGFGELYLKQTMASGKVPQISAVFGTCGGGSAISTALSDFTFMEASQAKLFVNTPNALAGNHIGKCDTSVAKFQAEAGSIDFVEESEEAVLSKVRELLAILPNSYEDDDSFEESGDSLNRLTPDFASKIEDVVQALTDVSDNQFFLEVKKAYAKDMVTGFIRINGMTVGVVANRVKVLGEDGKAIESFDGSLTAKGALKAADFVTFCDSFNIPVLTLTNVNGFAATTAEEKEIARASAKLTYAFANATVPKVTLLVGKAYGSAYIAMNSKHIGADMVFALPQAEIGMMEAKAAAEIIYSEEIEAKADKEATIEAYANEYRQLQASSEAAAKRGYVDAIIDPSETRKHVAYAF
ncbi:MAG: methylmalonyl-CoA decarboxylase subunit alpha, partial [Clostridiales bacterium]|nr:methylmalonyl-CoA decarboxylase subunit alpha [Clostridiales bacterium]